MENVEQANDDVAAILEAFTVLIRRMRACSISLDQYGFTKIECTIIVKPVEGLLLGSILELFGNAEKRND